MSRAAPARKPATRKAPPKVVPALPKTPFWYSWRHLAAYIYLFICFFDFVAMPVYYEFAHKPLSKTELVRLVTGLDPTNQVQAMQIISTEQRWEPLTLGESGLFHLAFGAILGVAAWTRGSQRGSSSRPGYFDSYAGGERGDDDFEFEEEEEPAPTRSRVDRSAETADGLDPFADNSGGNT
jgi:hypothetical protein